MTRQLDFYNPTEWGTIKKGIFPRLFFALFLTVLTFAALLSPTAVKKSFAVETFYVGAYWDSECAQPVTSIEWGELTPGSTSQVNIFLRNEELSRSCFAFMNTEEWNPPEAAYYLSLDWDYNSENIGLGETVLVTLFLKVDRYVHGITDFNFNIIIFGTEYILGDLDHDGIVSIFDFVEIAGAYGTTPSDSLWNPQADLNNDNVIDIYDIILAAANYMASS